MAKYNEAMGKKINSLNSSEEDYYPVRPKPGAPKTKSITAKPKVQRHPVTGKVIKPRSMTAKPRKKKSTPRKKKPTSIFDS